MMMRFDWCCCKWGRRSTLSSYPPNTKYKRVFGFYYYIPHFRGFIEKPWLFMLNLDGMCLKIKARSHFFSLGFCFVFGYPPYMWLLLLKMGLEIYFYFLPSNPKYQRVFGFYNYLPHFRCFLENPWWVILSLDEMCSVIEAWSQILFCFDLLCVRKPPHINGIRDWLLLITHQHKMRRVFDFYNHLPHFRDFFWEPMMFYVRFGWKCALW